MGACSERRKRERITRQGQRLRYIIRGIKRRRKSKMAAQQQQIKHSSRPIEIRCVFAIHNKSKSLALTIPPQWVQEMDIEPKQFLKLTRVPSGFLVEDIKW